MKVFLATLNIQHNIQSSMHYTATLSSFTIALTPFAYNSNLQQNGVRPVEIRVRRDSC